MAEYQVGQIYEGLKESDLYILTEFFKMLGNPARILFLLMEQDANVGDLAEQAHSGIIYWIWGLHRKQRLRFKRLRRWVIRCRLS